MLDQRINLVTYIWASIDRYRSRNCNIAGAVILIPFNDICLVSLFVFQVQFQIFSTCKLYAYVHHYIWKTEKIEYLTVFKSL